MNYIQYMKPGSKLWLNLEDAIKYARSTSTPDGGGAYYVTSQAKEDLRKQGKEEEAKQIEKAEAIGTVGGAIAGAAITNLPTFILTMKWLGTPAGKTLLGNIGKDMLVGTAGYLATDEASKAMTGKTVGQQVADGLGKIGLEKVPYSVREGIGNFANPGGWLTWGVGSNVANLLYMQGKDLIGKGILHVTPYVKSAIIASKLNREINKTTLPLYSTRYYTKSVGLPGHVNYTLHNADGSVAGGLKVESPYSAGTRGTHIEMVHKTSGSKGGVSEDLYNIAVKDALRAGLPGVESGLDLMNPLLTKHVTSKFPHIEEMIGTPQMVKNPTTGKWEFKQTIPGRMLTGTTSKLLALEAPQGHFITNYSTTAINTPSKTSLAFFERQPSKISKGERLGIPKGHERTIINNEEEILNNAKSFADKYGYEIPETIDAVKDMYKQHNSWFRTVLVDPLYDNSKYGLAFTDPKLQTLPKTESAKILASRGYPAAYRRPGDYEPGIYLDDFVFASPSMATNAGYLGNPGTYTVMLQRPFSFRNPLDWHNVADYRPISKYIYEPLLVGLTLIGNVGPKYELKLATKHLIPVKIAQPTDKGTLLGEYLGNIEYKSGGSIKIKKKNVGSFTRYCNGKVTEECIRKGKNSSNPTTRKRANFAWVARHKFKHEEGGNINYLNYFLRYGSYKH